MGLSAGQRAAWIQAPLGRIRMASLLQAGGWGDQDASADRLRADQGLGGALASGDIILVSSLYSSSKTSMLGTASPTSTASVS